MSFQRARGRIGTILSDFLKGICFLGKRIPVFTTSSGSARLNANFSGLGAAAFRGMTTKDRIINSNFI